MNWYKLAKISLSETLELLRPQLAQAAQRVYDQWEQDSEGYDEELGGGGICQDIAEAIAGLVHEVTEYEAQTIHASCGEQHVWVVVYDNDEGYEVDIPYNIYETGGGYNWTKIPDVQFDPTMISISPIDANILANLKEDYF